MKLFAIDAGTYSIKFLYFNLERKQLVLKEADEIVLQDVAGNFSEGLSPYALQAEILKELLYDEDDGKVLTLVPNALITSRYLSLPVTNRRKVDMMIPFQLDDDLPFTSAKAHFIGHLTKKTSTTSALLNITKTDQFDEYYNEFSSRETLPSVMTSELAVIQSYILKKDQKGPIAIVDIGHETTKCYVINDTEVVSNHISYTAGKILNNVIAKSYQISDKDAATYKHDNCFFLTDSQYDGVSKEQKDFAELMKQAIWPLVLDLKRWLLGFRVKHGIPIQTVYLTGGTSQINNIHNFLSSAVGINVESLITHDQIEDKSEILNNNQTSFYMAEMMAISQQSKQKPGNFLSGAYSSGDGLDLPLHSVSFIGSRTLIISLIVSAFLIIEGSILDGRAKSISKKLTKVIQQPQYEIPRVQRRNMAKRPERLLSVLKKKNRVVTQEVKTIQSAAKVNAIGPLSLLKQEISAKPGVRLVRFTSDGDLSRAEFKGKEESEIDELEKSLKASALKEVNIDRAADKLSLAVTFEIEGMK